MTGAKASNQENNLDYFGTVKWSMCSVKTLFDHEEATRPMLWKYEPPLEKSDKKCVHREIHIRVNT